jgi:hypothetical protein
VAPSVTVGSRPWPPRVVTLAPATSCHDSGVWGTRAGRVVSLRGRRGLGGSRRGGLLSHLAAEGGGDGAVGSVGEGHVGSRRQRP